MATIDSAIMAVGTILVAAAAIGVIVQISINVVSGSETDDSQLAQTLENKITKVCNEDQSQASVDFTLSSEVTIVLEEDTLDLQGTSSDEDSENEENTEWELPCSIDSSQDLEGSVVATIHKSEGSYVLE